MKKSMVIFIHTGFWCCYALLLTLILVAAFQGGNNGPSLTKALQLFFGFAVLPPIITFYAFHEWLFPKYLQQKKIPQTLIYGLGISIGASAIGAILISALFGGNFMFNDGFTSFISELIFMAFIASVVGVIGLVIKGFTTWYQEIKLKQTLAAKNHEMELALIKAQLNPHFLFNTLNNIDVLIKKQPDEASHYLNTLSEILRYMVFDTKTEKVPLQKEIEYIQKFVEIQKIRSSNPDYVSLNISGNLENRTVAPLIFIPFIENAFKYCGDKKSTNAISINIQVSDNQIGFDCSNITNNSINIENANGLGNELIKKRLALLYPNNHTLTINQTADSYKVSLTIQNEG